MSARRLPIRRALLLHLDRPAVPDLSETSAARSRGRGPEPPRAAPPLPVPPRLTLSRSPSRLALLQAPTCSFHGHCDDYGSRPLPSSTFPTWPAFGATPLIEGILALEDVPPDAGFGAAASASCATARRRSSAKASAPGWKSYASCTSWTTKPSARPCPGSGLGPFGMLLVSLHVLHAQRPAWKSRFSTRPSDPAGSPGAPHQGWGRIAPWLAYDASLKGMISRLADFLPDLADPGRLQFFADLGHLRNRCLRPRLQRIRVVKVLPVLCPDLGCAAGGRATAVPAASRLMEAGD